MCVCVCCVLSIMEGEAWMGWEMKVAVHVGYGSVLHPRQLGQRNAPIIGRHIEGCVEVELSD
jgi:hypothetical protein